MGLIMLGVGGARGQRDETRSLCVCVWVGVGGARLGWLQAASLPCWWFLHHLSPLQGSERPPPLSHLPDPTKALVSLLIIKEKVRRIRVTPAPLPGERLTSGKLPAAQHRFKPDPESPDSLVGPLWVLVQRLGLMSGQGGCKGTLLACLIPTQAFSGHPSLPRLLPNVSRRQASFPPKSTRSLTISPHFCCPLCQDPPVAPPSLGAKAKSLPWPAHLPTPSPH